MNQASVNTLPLELLELIVSEVIIQNREVIIQNREGGGGEIPIAQDLISLYNTNRWLRLAVQVWIQHKIATLRPDNGDFGDINETCLTILLGHGRHLFAYSLLLQSLQTGKNMLQIVFDNNQPTMFCDVKTLLSTPQLNDILIREIETLRPDNGDFGSINETCLTILLGHGRHIYAYLLLLQSLQTGKDMLQIVFDNNQPTMFRDVSTLLSTPQLNDILIRELNDLDNPQNRNVMDFNRVYIEHLKEEERYVDAYCLLSELLNTEETIFEIAYERDLELFKLLLNISYEYNENRDEGLWYRIIRNGDFELVKEILLLDEFSQLPASLLLYALKLAISRGDIEFTHDLLARNLETDILNLNTRHATDLLILATEKKDPDLIRHLAENFTTLDINFTIGDIQFQINNITRWLPKSSPVSNEIVQYLLQIFTSGQIQNFDARLFITAAIKAYNLDMVKFLIRYIEEKAPTVDVNNFANELMKSAISINFFDGIIYFFEQRRFRESINLNQAVDQLIYYAIENNDANILEYIEREAPEVNLNNKMNEKLKRVINHNYLGTMKQFFENRGFRKYFNIDLAIRIANDAGNTKMVNYLRSRRDIENGSSRNSGSVIKRLKTIGIF